jgi:hypothetical protein
LELQFVKIYRGYDAKTHPNVLFGSARRGLDAATCDLLAGNP